MTEADREDVAPSTASPERVVGWAAVAVTLAVVGVTATVWRPLAPSLELVGTDLASFDTDVLAAVDAYRGPRVPLALVATALPVVVPLLVVVSGPGRRLVHRLAGDRPAAPARSAGRAASVGLVVAVSTSLSLLPLALWNGFVRDGRWGLRTASFAGWLTDWTVRAAGRWLLVAVGVAVLVLAVRRWPRSWPYRLTVVVTAVAGLGVFLHPLVLLPLTLPTAPLEDPADAIALAPVLATAGDPDLPIHVGRESERSTRVNALATGLGPSARVVVYDNLLELPADQVASVVAHEIAHHEHRDLPRGVLLVAAGVLPAALLLRWVLGLPWARRVTGTRAVGDPRIVALVLLVVSVLELVAQPVTNAVSRRAEAAADARAVELTADPATLIAASRTFTVRDLATPEPATWITVLYRTHPGVGDRIRQAVAIAERDGATLPDLAELTTEERAQAHPSIVEGPP